MKKIIFLVILISSHSGAFSQKQFSGWLATFNTIKTGKKTSIHSDFQFRSAHELRRMQTLLLRGGINYHINKTSTITAGYAFIDNYRALGSADGYVAEHRIWEQYIYAHKINRLMVSHRFRLEQRFLPKTIIENNALKNDGSLNANRFRYFIRNILPLSKQVSFNNGIFAALQNEVFINFGNKENVNGKTFDQNRLYIALGHRFSKKFDLEAGYMNQYINGRSNTSVNNHIVQIAGYMRL